MEHFALDILLKKEGETYVPSQAARELSEKYDEVLLDEYQDSNLVQEILMQTVSGWVNERKNIYGRRCKAEHLPFSSGPSGTVHGKI